ncbi:ovarian cancer G-protein coupled receptor 1-like [Myripristis murdjan]|uniref:ovarian cancer G-protein coupled receptor 1-like n=1 Tax=Myripristis murdjan TaxID=586833 RepID=UPI001176460C|nr:ovarian cancer G-protein coupled receptor 1-like [Myripristis murdjan]
MDLYNISFDTEYLHNISTYEWEFQLPTTFSVASCIVSSISLPLTLLAIYALYSQVQENNVAPVSVINLLISDLIQMCCFVIWMAGPKNLIMPVFSVGFMVCVAMERYTVIACPLWFHFRRNISFSLLICIIVWCIPLVHTFLNNISSRPLSPHVLLSIYLLLPFPLLIFFLAGTLKALSSSISVPSEEKRQIVGTLVLVLLNYTLLFVPLIILFLSWEHELFSSATCETVPFDRDVQLIFLQLSPLMDLVLYVFVKKGSVDKLLAFLCRCRMTTEQEQGQVSTVDSNTLHTVSSM